MNWAVRFLFSILFLFGAVSQLAWAGAPAVDFLLAGPPVSVMRALRNLNDELQRPDSRFKADDVSIALEVWDVSEILGTASDDPERLAETDALRVSQAELEATLRRPLATRNRRLTHEEATAFQEKIADTAELLWPLYEKLGIRQIPVEPSFVSRRTVLWNSISNPRNLAKGAARFLALSFLIGYDLRFHSNYSLTHSAILATVASSLSFCLMAGVDLYDSMVVSPFWSKIPTPQYWYALENDPQRDTSAHKWKQTGMTVVKDFIVYATYLTIFTTASIQLGVAPDSWLEIGKSFFKTAALGIACETSIRATIARAKKRAISRLDMSDFDSFTRQERRILNIAATASFFQSVILTPLEMSAALGRTGSQLALAGLSAIGASGYILTLASPRSRLGTFRDEQLIPLFTNFFGRVTDSISRTVTGTCRHLASLLRP